jgi:hypothetical protein
LRSELLRDARILGGIGTAVRVLRDAVAARVLATSDFPWGQPDPAA